MNYPGYDYTDAELDNVPDNGLFDPQPADSQEETPSAPAFVIDSEERANWLLRKLAGIDAEKARVKIQTEKRLQELDSDRESLLFRFGAQIEAWAKEESLRRRRQTVTLQQGSLAFRCEAPRLVIGEYTTALTTAKATCPTAVTVETVTNENLDKKAFLAYAKAHFEATGEKLPGIDRTPGKESFSIVWPGANDKKGVKETGEE